MFELKKLRKELHKYPELSGTEQQTRERIVHFLRQFSNPEICTIGGQSIVAIYDYRNPGPTIIIRCELDALPIEDKIDTPYRSTNPKVGHKCGHDGHMAIVAGLAIRLRDNPPHRGKVILLFQSAEEIGTGAKDIVSDATFRELRPDYIFALHNVPGHPLGEVILTKDFFSATVQSLIIRLQGLESHASEPENGRNPTLAVSEIIQRLDGVNMWDTLDPNYVLITPIHVLIGTPSYGISPGQGELHYTIRTWDEKNMSKTQNSIQGNVIQVASAYGLSPTFEWIDYFPAAQNDKECNTLIEKVASNLDLPIHWKPHPFKFGEDFGWYSKRYKSAMFGIGAGLDTPPLHNPFYDFPDELIEPGMNIFSQIIADILH